MGIFNDDELEELRKAAEQDQERMINEAIEQLNESGKYRQPLEKILADRKAHSFIFDIVKKREGRGVNAVYLTC